MVARSGSANAKFQTHLFVPWRPALALGGGGGGTDDEPSGYEYELRVLNRANARVPAAADLLAVVPLDGNQLKNTGAISFPLSHPSNAALDTRLKHAGAVLTVRVAALSAHSALALAATATSGAAAATSAGAGAPGTAAGAARIRPDRVLLSVSARNLPVAPPPPPPPPALPRPTGDSEKDAEEREAAKARANEARAVAPKPLGHSVVCALVPVGAGAGSGSGSGDVQQTEAIVGNPNPSFSATFSVPRPSALDAAALYDLFVYAAPTDPSASPDPLTALGLAPLASASTSSASASASAGSGSAGAAAASGEVLAVIRVELRSVLSRAGGCATWNLSGTAPTAAAQSGVIGTGVQIAPGSGQWASKMKAADATLTLVAVTTQPVRVRAGTGGGGGGELTCGGAVVVVVVVVSRMRIRW